MTFYCTPPIHPPACLFMASDAILDGQQISWNPSCLWTPRCILGVFRRFAEGPPTATWTRPGGGIVPPSLALDLGPSACGPIAPIGLNPWPGSLNPPLSRQTPPRAPKHMAGQMGGINMKAGQMGGINRAQNS